MQPNSPVLQMEWIMDGSTSIIGRATLQVSVQRTECRARAQALISYLSNSKFLHFFFIISNIYTHA
jgi:hypothetical protein